MVTRRPRKLPHTSLTRHHHYYAPLSYFLQNFLNYKLTFGMGWGTFLVEDSVITRNIHNKVFHKSVSKENPGNNFCKATKQSQKCWPTWPSEKLDPLMVRSVMLLIMQWPRLFSKAALLQDKMQMNDVCTIPVHEVSSWWDAFYLKLWALADGGEKSKSGCKRNPNRGVREIQILE